jgi:hypothetical protein
MIAQKASVPEASQFIGDCSQIVAIDLLYHLDPMLIHGVRVHGTQDSSSNGGYGVAVTADVRSQENGLLG